MTRPRIAPLITFMRARLSPQGYLGLHLTIGALLLITASLLFAGIAEDVVTGDSITTLDVQLAHWFHSNATLPLTRLFLFVTHLHGTPGLILLSSLLALFLLWKKQRYWLLTLAVAVPGGMLLNVLLKHIFQRARPTFDEPLLTLTTFSFPSGHAAGTTVFYGVLAAYLICTVKPWPWRIVIALSAVTLVALVALSRLYLGVHYLSDVLAGIIEGIAWLALSLTAVSTFRRRQAERDLIH